MSLINSMLAGLEDRQAYMSEGQDLVLEGLTSINDDTFHDNRQKVTGYFAIAVLLLAGVFLSGYMYKHFLDNKTVQNKVAKGRVASVSRINRSANTDTGGNSTVNTVAVNKPLLQQQSPNIKSMSLKMDYNITGTLAAPAQDAAEAGVASEKADAPKLTTGTSSSTNSLKDNVPKVTTGIKPSITSFKVSSIDGGSAVVRLKLSDIADYRVYELNKPYRVAVEFEKFLSLPESIPKIYGQGLVSRIRGHHIYNNKRTMVVFDLSGKGKVKNSEIQEGGDGYTLMVQITPSHPDRQTTVAENSKAAGNTERPATHAVTGAKANRGTLSVTRKNSTPEQILASGLHDYQKGDIRDGLEQITNALEIDPKYIKARSTLVNLLIEQNDIPAAIRVLDAGIALLPKHYNWRELKAKLLVKLNNYDDAIGVLTQSGPEVTVNPEYYAFLAALLQQQGRNAEAVGYYKSVVAARGDNGIWWMGLGISLERTGKPGQARDAYRKAVNDKSLTPEIRNYIENRITVLSG